MAAPKTTVKVTIGSDEYALRSDKPEEYTRAVAEHVNRALKDVLAAGPMVESHKAAILAALAITDELFQTRRSGEEVADRLQALTAELSRLLPPAKRNSRSIATAADGT
jgi:cell division protein ZapA